MSKAYSMRLLNPFRGLAQVVEIDGADAVSRDSLNWALYIQGEIQEEVWPDGSVADVALPDIKFGTWSEQAGLKRAPVRQVIDYDHIANLGYRLLEEIKRLSGRLPFAQGDRYELWLLDSDDDLPLALLGSRASLEAAEESGRFKWRPGGVAQRAFRARATPSKQPPGKSDADSVASLINGTAGEPPRARWFLRTGDGSGQEMEGGRWLPADHFPELLVREQWKHHPDRELVQNFLEWQSPWLLALQTLEDDTRARLEPAAFRRSLTVAEQYRSYPKVIDREGLRASLVQALMRRSAGETEYLEEKTTTTFFVTGN